MGGPVEKETAAWNFVIVPVDTIEITVEKEYYIFPVMFLYFQMMKIRQGNDIIFLQRDHLVVDVNHRLALTGPDKFVQAVIFPKGLAG